MLLERVHLAGFASWREKQEISLVDHRLIAITGPNGAGKSSLLEAVLWALYGWTRNGDVDGMVSTGQEHTEVSVVFLAQGKRWRVTRMRKRGSRTRLVLEQEGDLGFEDRSASTIPETERRIVEVLGMDASRMLATLWTTQGDAGRFSGAMRPTERRKMLEELLDVGRFVRLAEKAAERARQAHQRFEVIQAKREVLSSKEHELEQLERLVQQVESRLERAEAEVAAAEKEMERTAAALVEATQAKVAAVSARQAGEDERKRIVEDLHRAEAALSAAQQRLSEVKQRYTEVADQVARIEEKLSGKPSIEAIQRNIERRIADIRAIDERKTKIAGEMERAKVLLAQCEERLVGLQEEQKTLAARRATLQRSGERCFTCNQHLDEEARQVVLTTLQEAEDVLKERLAEIDEQRRNAQNTLRNSTNALREEEAARSQAEKERETFEAALQARKDLETTLKHATKELAGLRTILDERQAVVERAIEERDRLAARRDELLTRQEENEIRRLAQAEEQAQQEHERQRQAYQVLRRARDEVLVERERRLNERNRVREDIEAAKALGPKMEEAREEAQLAQMLVQACRRDIPQMLVHSVVQDLEARCQEVLSHLTEGRLAVQIATARQRKNDQSEVDTLEVVISDAQGPRPYSSWSGGERFRIDLALRIGLAEVLGKGVGLEERTVVVDEGWGALDPEGIDAVLRTIQHLEERVGRVLTVTHTPEVASRFPVRLTVSRDATGSSTSALQL